jgi:hypothetical protein
VQRTSTPLSHGLVTAVGTYLAAQSVFVIVRLARGGDVSWFATMFNASVMLLAGSIGGVLGRRLQQAGAVPGGRR